MTTPSFSPGDPNRPGNRAFFAKIAALAIAVDAIATVTVKTVGTPPQAVCVGLSAWQLFSVPVPDTASIGSVADTLFVTNTPDLTYTVDTAMRTIGYATADTALTTIATVCMPTLDSGRVLRLVPSLPVGATRAGVAIGAVPP